MSNPTPAPRELRTLLIEILLTCRRGLDLKQENIKGVSYGTDNLTMFFRYDDGILYSIRLKSHGDAESNT